MIKNTFLLTEEERCLLASNMRESRGVISQRTMADRMGIPRQAKHISLMENKKKEPSQSFILAFAQVLGKDVYDIISKETFGKLEISTVPSKPLPFDVQKAKEDDTEYPQFDIMIAEGLLQSVQDKNVFNFPISNIIAAGLNHFLNLAMFDSLEFVIKNVDDKEAEKMLVKMVTDNKDYKSGIEVFRSLLNRP